ncbi:MAG TPA: hypothetical protein VIC60_05850 [Thermomicrobiales bacterium]
MVTTAATYRDAVTVTAGTLGGGKDDCQYLEVAFPSPSFITATSTDVSGCGALTLQPAAYPLWRVVGPGYAPTPGGPPVALVKPNTEVPPVGTKITKAYITETFR